MYTLLVSVIVLILRRSEGLLQVHTRLAGAILKQAINEAVREKDTYLAEAERLLLKAEAIDQELLRLQGQDIKPKTQLDNLFSQKRVGRIKNLEAPEVQIESISKQDLKDISTLYLLTWQTTEKADRAALALPPGVLISLTSETQARQIAHIMAQLDDFPLNATPLSIDEAANLAGDAKVLGIIFPDDSPLDFK